jgi:hypothetical protein
VVSVEGDDAARAAWQSIFAPLPPATGARADVRCRLRVVEGVPASPDRAPDFSEGDLLRYWVDGDSVRARFPRFGQIEIDLDRGASSLRIVPAALHTYGVFEDMVAIALSPHLRRRRRFLIHAFAACLGGRAALIVGGIGAGKTTTGLSLLDAGWKLLSNDSPLVADNATILSHPGRLAAFPDTFERFASTRHLAGRPVAAAGRAKIVVAAESVWPEVWAKSAPAGAILFPRIETRPDHRLEPLGPAETLRRLLPHAVERWDKPMIPPHLEVLGKLAAAAPGFELRLSHDVSTVPALVASVLRND